MATTIAEYYIAELLDWNNAIIFYNEEMEEIEQKLAQAQHQIDRERENIHILRAEWSHLNEPKRLQKLAGKYLDILPMKTDQVVAIIGNSENKDHFKGIFPRAHLASVKGVE